MTGEPQSLLEASGIEWPALWNHMPCWAHVIQLAVSAFMSSLGLKGRTKSWDAHECDQQCGENENIDIGKSQRLRKQGNVRIDRVSAMGPGIAKIIDKVRISWYFECPETDLHIAQNACCIDDTDTGSPKRVHWLSKSLSPNRCTSDYGRQDPVDIDPGVAQARLPIKWIHMRVAEVS